MALNGKRDLLLNFGPSQAALIVWRQLLVLCTTACLLSGRPPAIWRIPPRTEFPINTPSNNASSLSWYPPFPTQELSLIDCYMFLCKYINAFYKPNQTPWYVCLIEGWPHTELSLDHLSISSELVKYKGPILHGTWPALGSNDLNLDQSGTSIQILPEPNAGHVTHFFL